MLLPFYTESVAQSFSRGTVKRIQASQICTAFDSAGKKQEFFSRQIVKTFQHEKVPNNLCLTV